ncbi:ribonuclease G [Amylibacter kogurei]|uniref:Ribonuclease G n=1 Tax=Paramylibacter kogurei TaxID=1889778 RepID=A0A2G5K3K4_9RHOB|nr:ribonuclease E/G [Amylibacter kogurei]PIB24118.1 ribonuclease G [Amylibacter kogurei]
MKNGRIAAIDHIDGRSAAALLVDGTLDDLLIDAKSDGPQPESIYRAKSLQPMKGQNGIILDLGHGKRGFLRNAKGISPGTTMLVQVATHAESGKAAPVVQKLLFKSRYAIITPDAPGLNIARRIRDDDERERLLEIAHSVLDSVPENFGLILRSSCELVADEAIADDITAMRDLALGITGETSGAPEMLLAAPDAATKAWRDWVNPDPDAVHQDDDCFETLGVWDHIHALEKPRAPLPAGASMIIEPTSALVAVDVNTGNDFSLSAGLKANMAVARELPRQLRLRGLGGQIVLDLAPMPKKDRRAFENALRSAFKADGIDTALVGWTPLGHYELQRKRERIPLNELL